MSHSESDRYNQNQEPNYYAVITADVRYCKNLEPNAKLLYAEITCLSNKYGFCWATNGYFAKLYDVNERTVNRWITSLRNEGFISIIHELNGDKDSRKIFLVPVRNKIISNGRQKCQGGVTKMSGGGDKNVLPHNIYNTKQNTKRLRQQHEVVVVSDIDSIIKKIQSHMQKFVDEFGVQWLFSSVFLEKMLRKYGEKYFIEQLNYMISQQGQAFKDEKTSKTKKTPRIDKPEVYIKLACEKNYAEFIE